MSKSKVDNISIGAGIFIDRCLIIADGCQYIFNCQKWLDSEQVDGKIERLLRCSSQFRSIEQVDTSIQTSVVVFTLMYVIICRKSMANSNLLR